LHDDEKKSMEVAKKLEKLFSELYNINLCISYPVDVCYVIFYTKKSGVNQNIETLLMPLFFRQLFSLLFSPTQNLDSDCPCPLCLIPVPKKIPMCFLSKLANC
jgi:hypothetical protein